MFHRPPILHRLFFALKPPPILARQIAEAATWFDPCQRLAADRLHVTMFILDDRVDLSPILIDTLRDVGSQVRAAPIDIRMDVATASPRSIALRPARRDPALAALHRQLADHAAAAGVPMRRNYRFAPHLTLGYLDGTTFSRPVAPIGWRAAELVLIDSHVGRTRHAILGHWPLTPTLDAQLDLF